MKRICFIFLICHLLISQILAQPEQPQSRVHIQVELIATYFDRDIETDDSGGAKIDLFFPVENREDGLCLAMQYRRYQTDSQLLLPDDKVGINTFLIGVKGNCQDFLPIFRSDVASVEYLISAGVFQFASKDDKDASSTLSIQFLSGFKSPYPAVSFSVGVDIVNTDFQQTKTRTVVNFSAGIGFRF